MRARPNDTLCVRCYAALSSFFTADVSRTVETLQAITTAMRHTWQPLREALMEKASSEKTALEEEVS